MEVGTTSHPSPNAHVLINAPGQINMEDHRVVEQNRLPQVHFQVPGCFRECTLPEILLEVDGMASWMSIVEYQTGGELLFQASDSESNPLQEIKKSMSKDIHVSRGVDFQDMA